MSMEAGDIIIYDLYFLPCKAGVFIKNNLVLLAVLRERNKATKRTKMLSAWWDDRRAWGLFVVRKAPSYNFNRAECNNGVAPSAVSPGIPARILPLLKHVLLPLAAGLLVSHPSDRTEEETARLVLLNWSFLSILCAGHLLLIHKDTPLFIFSGFNPE